MYQDLKKNKQNETTTNRRFKRPFRLDNRQVYNGDGVRGGGGSKIRSTVESIWTQSKRLK